MKKGERANSAMPSTNKEKVKNLVQNATTGSNSNKNLNKINNVKIFDVKSKLQLICRKRRE